MARLATATETTDVCAAADLLIVAAGELPFRLRLQGRARRQDRLGHSAPLAQAGPALRPPARARAALAVRARAARLALRRLRQLRGAPHPSLGTPLCRPDEQV